MADVIRQVSPGFYFQRCLPLWKEGLREIQKDQKATAIRPLELPAGQHDVRALGDRDLYGALLARQARTFRLLAATSHGVELQLRNVAPFVTGIGQPHPLENGFAFLKPYGVPYLAGSGVKGAVRAACAEFWNETCSPEGAKALLLHYFGSEDKEVRSNERADHRRGALVFLDLFPDVSSWEDVFRLDIVNPHYGPYYQRKDVPADWHSPVPSYFLTLRADLEWRLRVLYLPADPSDGRAGWASEICQGLAAALTREGLGAKKSWGYGLFGIEGVDPDQAPWSDLAGPRSNGEVPGIQVEGPAGGLRLSRHADTLRQLISTLKASEVGGRMPAIAGDLERCTTDERPSLVGRLHARLKELGLREREIRQWVKRFPVFAPPEEK